MDHRQQKTLNEMLVDRGYKETFTYSDNDFYIIDGKLCVYVVTVPKIGINIVKNLQSYLEEHNLAHAMLFYKDSITAFAKQQLDELRNNTKIETFSFDEMIFNITKHTLVPKHTLISHEEKRSLCKKFNINEKRLPQIKSTDPVSRYYGAIPGDVFRIIRPSESTCFSTYYRLVVN